MFNKLYVEIKNTLKENYKFLITLIIIFVICSIKLPYTINTPGGLINLTDRITIDNKHINGSINMLYVSEYRATIPTLIIDYFNKTWDREDYVDRGNTSNLMLKEANNNAIYVAFNLANENIEVLNKNVYVTYVDSSSKSNLICGDEILSVDNNIVNNLVDLTNLISNYSIGDKVKFKVKNNNKEYIREAIVYEKDNKKIVGIVISQILNLKTDKSVDLKFKNNESGPSGGFITALSIYNGLTENDITKGLKIAGTGTISIDGSVGSIGGIKYKVIAASKAKVDVLFVPNSNYEEAMKVIDENKIKINIVSINNIKDAIDYLNNL